MEKAAKIYVAGHRGMVGSAIVRKLEEAGYNNLLLRTSSELDLRDQHAVIRFFRDEKPDYIFMAAAKVGGILANNTYRADFLYDNLMIAANVIHQAWVHNVKKLLFLGSSCIYPKMAPQPIKEEFLLTDTLEPTNEPYAIAKIAGIKLCQTYRQQYGARFVSLMPTNLYGPNDNYDPQNSHVLPALLRRFHEAKLANHPQVEIWGSGTPKREFLHVDDLADACLHIMLHYEGEEALNVGTGKDLSIAELAQLVKKIVGYEGEITYDHTKPDGTPRKLLDVSKIEATGWNYRTGLEEGITRTYQQSFG
jgi:GDP-L-fucose synthase